MKSSILLVISVLTAGVIGKEAPIVSTRSGEVLGIVEKSFESNDYFSYKGIPFAEPPTGNLRFRVNFCMNNLQPNLYFVTISFLTTTVKRKLLQ